MASLWSSTKRLLTGEAAALCVMKAFCGFVLAALPIWITSLSESSQLSLPQIGWVASAEGGLLGLGVLGFALFGSGVSPRIVVGGSLALVIVANLVAMVPNIPVFIASRLVNGAAFGVFAASVTMLIARRAEAVRLFGITTAAIIAATAGVNLMLPLFLGDGRLWRLFAIIAAAGVVSAGFVLALQKGVLPRPKVEATSSTRVLRLLKPAPVLVILATLVFGVSSGMIGPYAILIGRGLGFNADQLGLAMAICGSVAILGALVVTILGERAGVMAPIAIGVVTVACGWLVMVNAPTIVVFAVAFGATNIAGTFLYPYKMGLVGRVDPTGRLSSMTPGVGLAASMLGPAIGAAVVGGGGFHSLAVACASGTLLALALAFAAVSRIAPVKVPALVES